MYIGGLPFPEKVKLTMNKENGDRSCISSSVVWQGKSDGVMRGLLRHRRLQEQQAVRGASRSHQCYSTNGRAKECERTGIGRKAARRKDRDSGLGPGGGQCCHPQLLTGDPRCHLKLHLTLLPSALASCNLVAGSMVDWGAGSKGLNEWFQISAHRQR